MDKPVFTFREMDTLLGEAALFNLVFASFQKRELF